MRRFLPLEQEAYRTLEQAPYLKGLLRPFKGKGGLEAWASECRSLRDGLIELSERRILAQTRAHPFNRLGVTLAQQPTAAGTTFLRWRSLDHARMGVGLWEAMLNDPATPDALIDDLVAMEEQRIALNMQIGLVHALARQAEACAGKMARAEAAYLARRGRSR
jgi:hypothetical protein